MAKGGKVTPLSIFQIGFRAFLFQASCFPLWRRGDGANFGPHATATGEGVGSSLSGRAGSGRGLVCHKSHVLLLAFAPSRRSHVSSNTRPPPSASGP